jgi:hypothetical protein
VNRQNLHYQLRKYLLQKSEADSHFVDGIVGLDVNVVDSQDSAISPLTEPEERTTFPIERPKKNSKKRALEEEKVLKSNLTTLASERFKGKRDEAARNGKYVEKNCLRNIIQEIEAAHELPENTLKHATIRRRVLVNNTSGKQHASPLEDIEELVVNMAIMRSQMGEPFNKQTLIAFTTDLIANTYHADNLIAFKKQRLLMDQEKDLSDEKVIPGARWYQGFMKRNKHRIRTEKLLITDVNRNSYVTKEYFKDMYNKVYAEMVTAGVAVELEHEVMLDKNGNEVDDESKIYGLPTIVRPENIVFVDETGCNTNMKLDGKVGGETFIISCDKTSRGMNGSMGEKCLMF